MTTCMPACIELCLLQVLEGGFKLRLADPKLPCVFDCFREPDRSIESHRSVLK